jgi:hypothetical protein
MTLHDSLGAGDQTGRVHAQSAECRRRFAHQHSLVCTRGSCHISQTFYGMHFGQLSEGALPSHLVATNPSANLVLAPLGGDPRPLADWLTTFHLASVVLDPYTNESSWLLKTAARILGEFKGAAVRVNLLVTCDPEEAKAYLGPLAEEFLVFCDPDKVAVKELGLQSLPAFVFVRSDLTVAACAEGWNPSEWRGVAEVIAQTTAWSKPTIPVASDPAPYNGSRT